MKFDEIDHIAIQVKDIKKFRKKLAKDSGLNLEKRYRDSKHKRHCIHKKS